VVFLCVSPPKNTTTSSLYHRISQRAKRWTLGIGGSLGIAVKISGFGAFTRMKTLAAKPSFYRRKA
jgi:hypothetical protein